MTHLPIRETLEKTCDQLGAVRKRIYGNGHVDELRDIDTLVSVAKGEAEKKLSRLDDDERYASGPSADPHGT